MEIYKSHINEPIFYDTTIDDIHLIDVETKELLIKKFESLIHVYISTELPTRDAAIYMLNALLSYKELYFKLRPPKIEELD
jgi:hypothetical protein